MYHIERHRGDRVIAIEIVISELDSIFYKSMPGLCIYLYRPEASIANIPMLELWTHVGGQNRHIQTE